MHARIFYRDNQIFIEDMNSTNGTRINGIKIFDVTKLRDGDEIELGRKGVRFEFYREIEESEDAPLEKIQPLKLQDEPNKTLRMVFQNAAKKAKEQGGGSLNFIKQVAKQVSNESTTKLKIWLLSLTAIILLIFIALITIIIILISELHTLQSSKQQSGTNSLEKTSYSVIYPDAGNHVSELDPKDRKELEQLKQENERIKKLISETLKFSDNKRFKEVNKAASKAVFLIFSVVTLMDKKTDKKYLCKGCGTGFVVSPEGYLVTNKHVIKPWLFDKTAAEIQSKGYKVLERTHNILAWRTGNVALTDNREIREDTAYSLRNHQLEIYDEGITRFITQNIDGFGEVKVHAKDNDDLAILKLEGSDFPYLKLYSEKKGQSWKPDQLTKVLTIGFPEGIDFLEGVKVQTSPSLGEIRKVERTIAISAPITRGNSGGPVIAINADTDEPVVIGVVTRIVKDTETMGICIKSSYINALLPDKYKR